MKNIEAVETIELETVTGGKDTTGGTGLDLPPLDQRIASQKWKAKPGSGPYGGTTNPTRN